MENKDEIGASIRRTHHDIKVFVDRYVNAHLPNHLTGIEGLIVGYIFHHTNVVAGDIMESFHLQKATISQALTNLEKKDVIRMAIDKKDKRKKIITLTKKGEDAHKEFEALYISLIPTIEQGINEEDKATFLRVCEQIRKNVGGKI